MLRDFLPNRSAFSLFSKLTAFALVGLLVSCSKPAKFPPRVDIEDIIRNIRCELYEAVWGGWYGEENRYTTPWMLGWKADVELTLQVERTGGLDGDGKLTVPITRGTYSISLVSGLKKVATTKSVSDFSIKLSQYKNPNIESCEMLDPHLAGKRRRRLLSGDLGINEWLSHSIDAYDRTGVDSTGMTYRVEFVLTANGSVAPGINITNPTGENFIGNLKLSGSKEKTHLLVLTFAKDTQTIDQVPGLLENILAAINELANDNKDIELLKAILSALNRTKRETELAMQKNISPQNLTRESTPALAFAIDDAIEKINEYEHSKGGSTIPREIMIASSLNEKVENALKRESTYQSDLSRKLRSVEQARAEIIRGVAAVSAQRQTGALPRTQFLQLREALSNARLN